jgi:hypothetical protein
MQVYELKWLVKDQGQYLSLSTIGGKLSLMEEHSTLTMPILTHDLGNNFDICHVQTN